MPKSAVSLGNHRVSKRPKSKTIAANAPHELVDVYCDGPTVDEISSLDRKIVRGYTFNPTLFKSLGVINYLEHCRKVALLCDSLPVSLEVFADDEAGMIRQAGILGALGDNVFVKIPITYTSGESTLPVIRVLAERGVKLNITAVFTSAQVKKIIPILREAGAIISVFSGRLFDIGVDAVEETKRISHIVHENSNSRVLWASPRMVYDIKSAHQAGCDIITMQSGLIKKLSLFSKTPEEYSLDTVKMFYKDAVSSAYEL